MSRTPNRFLLRGFTNYHVLFCGCPGGLRHTGRWLRSDQSSSQGEVFALGAHIWIVLTHFFVGLEDGMTRTTFCFYQRGNLTELGSNSNQCMGLRPQPTTNVNKQCQHNQYNHRPVVNTMHNLSACESFPLTWLEVVRQPSLTIKWPRMSSHAFHAQHVQRDLTCPLNSHHPYFWTHPCPMATAVPMPASFSCSMNRDSASLAACSSCRFLSLRPAVNCSSWMMRQDWPRAIN